MKFGVFDHVDRGSAPLADLYEGRLRLAELYDRAGFHAYHIAEHHGTPLGMASAPSVLLAAVAQRTKRLRFGPLVYTLPVTHPLRVLEEICMLDQLSSGRLEVGVGRGSSPYEHGYFGVDAETSSKLYVESYQIILQGLQSREINFEGEIFKLRNVPVVLECVQKPHPPLWYGVSKIDAAPWAARNGLNIVCQGPVARIRAITDLYRKEWSETLGGSGAPMPMMGLGRHMMVAETAKEARDVARRAFDVWYRSLQHLWRLHGNPMTHYSIPEDFDAAEQAGIVIAGTPGDVTEKLKREIENSGANYVLTRFAYGDMSHEESVHSLNLFAGKVMPEFVERMAHA